MLETLLNGGPFMMVLLILVGSIIFISVKNIKDRSGQILRNSLINKFTNNPEKLLIF